MSKMKSVYTILEEWGIADDFTEDDLWQAIAEADGHTLDFYADGDLAEWL